MLASPLAAPPSTTPELDEPPLEVAPLDELDDEPLEEDDVLLEELELDDVLPPSWGTEPSDEPSTPASPMICGGAGQSNDLFAPSFSS